MPRPTVPQYTVIIVSDDTQAVRKFRLPRTWMRNSAVVFSLMVTIGIITATHYVTLLLREARVSRPGPDVRELELDLARAQEQLRASLAKAESLRTRLVDAARKQEGEVQHLQARYDELKALTAGKEELARAYREVLREPKYDWVWKGVLVGLLTQLVLWVVARRWLRRSEVADGSEIKRAVEKAGAHERSRE